MHPSQAAPEPAPSDDSTGLIRVEPWPDPVIDDLGHDPRSRYVEQFWLGVLGPSTTWLLRRLAERLDSAPAGFELDPQSMATALGVGMRNGRNSPFMRSIDRACQFGLARRPSDHLLEVRRHLPPLTQGQLKRLPGGLQEAHAAWLAEQLHHNDEREHKARRLALTLLELGEDIGATERQLCRWRIEADTARRATRWAHGRHARAKEAAAESGRPPAA